MSSPAGAATPAMSKHDQCRSAHQGFFGEITDTASGAWLTANEMGGTRRHEASCAQGKQLSGQLNHADYLQTQAHVRLGGLSGQLRDGEDIPCLMSGQRS
jgi:hypothetical protein